MSGQGWSPLPWTRLLWPHGHLHHSWHEYPSATRDIPQPCQPGQLQCRTDACALADEKQCTWEHRVRVRPGVTWVAQSLGGCRREGPCCFEGSAEPCQHTSSWLGAPKAVNVLRFLISLPFRKRRVLPRVRRGGLERDR